MNKHWYPKATANDLQLMASAVCHLPRSKQVDAARGIIAECVNRYAAGRRDCDLTAVAWERHLDKGYRRADLWTEDGFAAFGAALIALSDIPRITASYIEAA